VRQPARFQELPEAYPPPAVDPARPEREQPVDLARLVARQPVVRGRPRPAVDRAAEVVVEQEAAVEQTQ